MIKWLAVLVMWIVIEYAYTRLTVHIIVKNPPMAGFFSAIVVALIALTTVAYTQDNFLIFPAILGAGLGTYLTVRFAE